MRFRKSHPKAVAPHYATEGAGAFDLVAVEKKWVPRIYSEEKQRWIGGYFEYNTGIHLEIPSGYMGIMPPRSSGSDYLMELANEIGFIDSDYRGPLKLRYRPTHDWSEVAEPGDHYEVGDRIGQLAIVPVLRPGFQEADELDDTARGDGGFGSTDNKPEPPTYTDSLW